MEKKLNLLRLLFLIYFYYPISQTESRTVCVTRESDCEGSELDCSKSIPCFYGSCTEKGNCLCKQCWHGETCQVFVDKFQPKFFVKSRQITISDNDEGVVFIAKAYDADLDVTCSRSPNNCPCAQFTYSIVGNHEGLFKIDPHSGEISLSPGVPLIAGEEYELLVRATSTFQNVSSEEPAFDNMELIVLIEKADNEKHKKKRNAVGTSALQQNIHKVTQTRRKRSAGDKPEDTICSLKQSRPTTNKLTIGNHAEFQLEVLLPTGDIDANIEIFTTDPNTGKTTFLLCNPKFELGETTKVTSDQGELQDIKPELKENPELPGVVDRAVWNLGKLTNENEVESDNKSSTLIFTFRAMLIRTENFEADKEFYITSGVEFNEGKQVWVGQSKIQVKEGTEDEDMKYPTDFDITAESEDIYEEEAVVFTLNVKSTYPAEAMYLDIFSSDDEMMDLYSVGNARLVSVGNNYPCFQDDPLSFPLVFIDSDSEETKYRAILNISSKIMNGGSDRIEVNENDLLKFEFAVYALKGSFEKLQGNISFTAGYVIGGKTIWTGLVNITLNERRDQASAGDPVVSLVKPTEAVEIPENGTVIIEYKIVFTEKSFDDVKLVIEAPDSGELSLCQVRVSQRGFNIPYVPKFVYDKTELEDKTVTKMEIDLGRIQTTDQLKGNETANTLFLEVGVRNAKQADGLKIKFGIGSATVESPEIKTKDAGTEFAVKTEMTDVMDTQDLVENGETSLQILMKFENENPISPFLVEVMGELDNNTAPARICRVEVTTVGTHFPCVNKTGLSENAEYMKTRKENIYMDWGKIDFENVCPAINGNDDPMGREIKVTFVAEIPKSSRTEGLTEMWLSAGVKINGESIWTSSIRYDFKEYEDPDFENVFPLLETDQQTTDPVPTKQSTYAYFRIKLPPRTRAKYMLTIEANDATLSVCKISLLHIGHNMPCIDFMTYPGKEVDITNTWLNYEVQDMPETGNKKAIIDFGPLSNVGVDPLLTNTLKDRNTLLIGVGVRVNDKTLKDMKCTLKYTFVGGSNNTEGELTIIAGDAAEAATESTMETEFKTLDGTLDVYKDATKFIYLDIFIPPNLVGKMVVEFKNKDANEDFSFCSGSITFTGLNLPCINASLVLAETPEKDTCSDTIKLDLGDVCNSGTFPDKNENRLRIEVGLNVPPDSAFSNNMKIEASITVDELAPHVVDLEELTPKTDDFVPNNDNVDKDIDWTNVPVVTMADKPYDGKVADRFWLPFKITIPGNATDKLLITVEGDAANDRAIITLWDLRVKSAGINLGCLRTNYTLKSDLQKTDGVTTSQRNKIVADFGYVTNIGYSYRRGDYKEGDNDAILEVQVRMTDHPDAEENAIFPVTITLEWGTNTSSLIENVTVVRDKSETVKLNYKVTVKDKKELYQKGDQVLFDLVVFHENDSNLEPVLSKMRFFVPPYISYNTHTGNESVTKVDVPYIELEFSNFIFEDTYEVTLTMDIDNNNFLPKGDDSVTATIIARFLCTVNARDTLYPGRDKLSTCHAPEIVSCPIQKPACIGEIGVSSGGSIEDCQISASTSASNDTAPWKGRRGGDDYWVPAFRLGLDKQYFQVDMGNKTMVTGVYIQKVDGKDSINKYRIFYSDNGRTWKDGEVVTEVTYNDDNEHYYKFNTLITCRYIRLQIDNEAPTDPNAKAIGAKFEFSGCYLSGDKTVEKICAATPPTLNTNDVRKYRHFTVNEDGNGVYVCDFDPKKKNLNCYCSPDGKKWKTLPRTISSLVGYDSGKKVVYATDKKGKAFLKTTDCDNWSLATANDVESSDVKKSIPMPAVPADELGSHTLGDWKGDFEGLKLSDELKLTWKNCCG